MPIFYGKPYVRFNFGHKVIEMEEFVVFNEEHAEQYTVRWNGSVWKTVKDSQRVLRTKKEISRIKDNCLTRVPLNKQEILSTLEDVFCLRLEGLSLS